MIGIGINHQHLVIGKCGNLVQIHIKMWKIFTGNKLRIKIKEERLKKNEVNRRTWKTKNADSSEDG